MQKTLSIKAPDGSIFDAYAAYPETDTKASAVIVIQEIFGVNAVMRDICRGISQAGFIAVCPDLFWRQEKGVQLTDKTDKEWQKAFQLYQGFDIDLGVKDLILTLHAVRKDEACSGKAGTVGYCLGGKLAFLMATRSDADCNISYYGVDIDKYLNEVPDIRKPLLMHIAEKDDYVPLAAQHKILDALNKNPFADIHVYPGVNHAFARRGGKNYDKQAAQEANSRTADFLATHLMFQQN